MRNSWNILGTNSSLDSIIHFSIYLESILVSINRSNVYSDFEGGTELLRVAFLFFFLFFCFIDRFLISSNKVRKGGHTPRRDAIVLGSAFLWLALLARINREATGSLASQLSATTLWPINSFIGVTKQECPVNRSAVVLESETWPKLAKIPKPKFVSLSLMPRARVFEVKRKTG